MCEHQLAPLLVLRKLRQDIGARFGMLFHKLELALGEPAPLMQDLVRYRDLAQVVHPRCEPDELDITVGQTELLRGADGESGDILRVLKRVRVEAIDEIRR